MFKGNLKMLPPGDEYVNIVLYSIHRGEIILHLSIISTSNLKILANRTKAKNKRST